MTGVLSSSFLIWQYAALPEISASLTRPYRRWNWHGRLLQGMSFNTALPINLLRVVRGKRYLSKGILRRLCWRTSNQPQNMSCLSVLAILLVWAILFWELGQPSKVSVSQYYLYLLGYKPNEWILLKLGWCSCRIFVGTGNFHSVSGKLVVLQYNFLLHSVTTLPLCKSCGISYSWIH